MSINTETRKKHTNRVTELSKSIDSLKIQSKNFDENIIEKINDLDKRLVKIETDLEYLTKDIIEFKEELKNYEAANSEKHQELEGNYRQTLINYDKLVDDSEKETQSKKKVYDIIWQILIPIIGAGLLTAITISLHSCAKSFHSGQKEVVEYKNFNQNK